MKQAILEYRFDEFTAIVGKFNKKAQKWNLPLIEVTDVRHFTHKEIKSLDPITTYYHIPMVEFNIVGEVPRIAGWSITAKVSPSEIPGENFVFVNPGQEFDTELTTCKMFCDHCRTRRLKTTAYQIKHLDGRKMLVGATCLKDFLPGVDIQNLISYMSQYPSVSGESDEEERYSANRTVLPLSVVVRDCYLSIDKFGYMSKSKADEECRSPTIDDIDNAKAYKTLYKDMLIQDIVALDEQLAGCISDLLAMPTNNDFMMNLNLALRSEYVRPKLYAFIAAGVNMWIREQQKKREQSANPSQYVGAIGSRVVGTQMTITGLNKTEGMYGTTFIYNLMDSNGNIYVWFASKGIGQAGEVVDLKFTIKGHQEYRGVKQTIITRGVVQ